MRIFDDIDIAIPEIKRDLSKSPLVRSTRVQQLIKDQEAHEAMNYAYTMLPDTIPTCIEDIKDLGTRHFPYWAANWKHIEEWFKAQSIERMQGFGYHRLAPADLLHPALADLTEGQHYAYTYGERLIGAAEALFLALHANEDSRRAYWPIFVPLDAVRAHAPTRIPCSLGYHLMIRHNGSRDYLHCTYLQRSADFDIFWFSDLILAHLFRERVLQLLRSVGHDIASGQLTHIILSFHSFLRDDEEIY